MGVPNKTKAGGAVVLDLGLVLGHFSSSSSLSFSLHDQF